MIKILGPGNKKLPGSFIIIRIEKMKRGRIRRILVFIVLLTLIAGVINGILILRADTPPTRALNACREAISDARNAEAERYSHDIFLLASMNYEEALKEWRRQIQELYVMRDYSRMRSLITDATSKARQAEIMALQTRGSLKDKIELDLKQVNSEITLFEKNYYDLPLSSYLRNYFNKGKILSNEAQEAYKRGDYPSASEKLTSGMTLVEKANFEAKAILEDYMRSLSKWQRWVDETIAYSKNERQDVIIVDKMAHICQVYRNGKLKYEFTIEMGKNWLGDKQIKGDKATPEGKYKVTKKKNGRHTKYYKALLINYPNDQDKQDFEQAKRKGQIPRNSHIGNLIEIHGDGGRGTNWTEGCVALTNKDMDKLFELADVGTLVTIVGSRNHLSGFSKD